MPADLSAPDELTLRLFLLGRLTGPEADRVERYLETHPEAADTLRSLAAEDTFTSALRSQPLADEADPEVRTVIARLERLPAGAGERTTTREDGAESRADVDEDTEDGLQFLAPAQGADELGRLGGYRILRVLGTGGMGMVLEADDPKLGRHVAIKVMRPRVATSPKAVQRFLQEARAAAAVEHDHIIPIWYIGEDNGVPYIVMPFLKGQSLNARLNREDRLPATEIIRIGVETAEGLAAAHDRGLVHRDVKPANLWLEAPRGRVKVLDFGLARLTSDAAHLTQTGAIIGTPAYMAPEQARGLPVDARSDLFSLGGVLYRAATGRTPFTGTDTMSMLMSLASDNPADPRALNPALPPHLADLIVRLLDKDPAKRPQSAREVIARLTPPTVEALPDSGARRPEFAFDDDETQVEPEAAARAVPAEPEARRDWRSRGRGLTKAGIALALMAFIGVTVATYKLVFETKDGTLIVEVADADTEARFKNGELHLYAGDQLRYTIKPSEQNKKLPPGEYKVRVSDPNGLEVDTPEFTLKKGGQVTVRVTARPVVAAGGLTGPHAVGGPTSTPTGSPGVPAPLTAGQRKALEWALSVGARLTLTADGKSRTLAGPTARVPDGPVALNDIDLGPVGAAMTDAQVSRLADLPPPLVLHLNGTKVTDVGLARLATFPNLAGLSVLYLPGTPVTDAGLRHLARLTQLSTLVLHDTGVTNAGLAHLTALPKLTLVQVRRTRVTADGVNVLAAARPQCEIAWDGGVSRPAPPAGTIDLLARVDPKRDAVSGRWNLVEGKLTGGGGTPVMPIQERLQVPFAPPAEYDLTLRVERTAIAPGGQPLDIRGFVVTFAGPSQFQLILDCDDQPGKVVNGLQTIDGKLFSGNETTFEADVFPAKGPVRIDCEVRRDRVTVRIDGKERIQWTGDPTRLGLHEPFWTVPDKTRLALGVQNAEYRIHEWTVTPVAPDPAGPADWVSLFNGKDLTGWTPNDANKAKWKVVDGALTAEGADGYLSVTRAVPSDFHLRAEVSINEAGDSGVIVYPATPAKDPEAPMYEAELWGNGYAHTYRRDGRGGVREWTSKESTPAGRWFVYELLVRGGRLTSLADGKTLTDVTDPDPLRGPWTVTLQSATAATGVRFRKIEVRDLRKPAADPDRRAAEELLKRGGFRLDVRGPGGLKTDVWAAADLPAGPLEVEVVLQLGRTNDDAGLEVLKGLKHVAIVVVTGKGITDAGARTLAGLTSVQELGVGQSAVTDEGIKHLAGLTGLTFLSFTDTPVTDAGLVHLKPLTRLRSLYLEGTQVTDDGLTALSGLRAVDVVDLRRTKVTETGVKKLATARPGCKITWDGGVIEPRK